MGKVYYKACGSMAEIPNGVVQTCVTSPPYWGLRSYHGEPGMIGLEPTVGEYVVRLVEAFREVKRVLRDDGTLWLNIGDAYAGSWGAQSRGASDETSTLEGSQISGRQIAAHPRGSETGSIKRTPGMKPKDMIGLPWMVAFALRADGWYLRSDIIWHKPNPMPSSVTDRPTSSHEHIFLLSKSKRYFFDADAIREPLAESSLARLAQNVGAQAGSDRANGGAKTNGPMKAVATGLRFGGANGIGDSTGSGERLRNGQEWRARIVLDGDQPSRHGDDVQSPFVGANARDVWTIATRGYKGAHFATFPEELARRCILAGSPPGALVLDPFLGSGTTTRVALECGRDYVGYEISENYRPLIEERLGLFADPGSVGAELTAASPTASPSAEKRRA